MGWIRAIVISFLLLVMGGIGLLAGTKVGVLQSQEQVAGLQRENKDLLAERDQLLKKVRELPKQEVAPTLPPAPAPDHDRLLRWFRITDDKGWGVDYTLEQVASIRLQEENKDYKKVLAKYVSEVLQKQIATFQTVSHRVNPREVLVTTTDRNAFLIKMEKWNKFDGVWAVTGTNQMPIDPDAEMTAFNRYRTLKIYEAPAPVQKWANQLLTSPGEKREYLRQGRKIFALLKTTNSSPTDSVEIENLMFSAGEVHITYQTYEYGKQANPMLINDYLLLEIDYEANDGVTFTESFRTAE